MKFRLIIDKEKPEELVATVHRRTPLIDQIEALVCGAGAVDEVIGYDRDKIRMLKISEVEAFYIQDGKTYAACADGQKYRVKMHLYELERVVPGYFRKINKSNIANMKKILRFHTALNGAVDAEFKSGFRDYVSRRCFAELKRRYSL